MVIWIDLGSDQAFVVADVDEGLSCSRLDGERLTGTWVLRQSRPKHVAACAVRGELWVVTESKAGIRVTRGDDGDWKPTELELTGRLQALAIVPGVDGAHILSLVGDMGQWILWHHALNYRGSEVRRVKVHSADGDNKGAITAISDRSGRLHLMYGPGGGPLYYRVAFPPLYAWSNAGVLSNPNEEIGLWSILLDGAGGLHALWAGETGLFYRFRLPGGWPCGQWSKIIPVTALKTPPPAHPLLISHDQTLWAAWHDGKSWWWRPLSLPAEASPLPSVPNSTWQIAEQGPGLRLSGSWASRVVLSGTPPRPLDLTRKQEPLPENTGEPAVQDLEEAVTTDTSGSAVMDEETVAADTKKKEPVAAKQEDVAPRQSRMLWSRQIRSRRNQRPPRIRLF